MSISNNSTGIRPGVCTSLTRPTTPYVGQVIYETDSSYLLAWDGTSWSYFVKAYNNIPRSITGAADTPIGSDNGKLITIDTTSGAVTITINSSLALSSNQRIDFTWMNAATSVTFAGSGVTLNATPGLKLRARYSSATLLCISNNNYVLAGDLSA